MSQFVMRFFYFLEEDIESFKKLSEIFSRNGFFFSAGINYSLLMQPGGIFYNLDYPQGKLKILAVKTPLNDDCWEAALNDLRTMEEEDILLSNDIMGYLTILAGDDLWEELLKKSEAIFSEQAGDLIEMKNGKMQCLERDLRKGVTIYQYGSVDNGSVNNAFLLRGMPILHASMLRLQALDFILNDRLSSIRREKEEMQQDLIRIMHTKLVMDQALLMAAEELENEIQILATAYGKLVGDQNMVADGLKNLETALLRLDKQINEENALLAPAVLFAQITQSYQQRREDLRNIREVLNEVQENYRAAIDVVQSKIQVMNSRTNIATQEQIKGLLEINTEMQKQGLVFQYAAGLIEFIVLAYYSHTLWSHLQHVAYTVIPSWIQFTMVLVFSGNIVWATHLIAEYHQGEVHVRKKLILALVLFLLLFAAIIFGSIMAGSYAAGH